jgi:hypothetical protein
MNLVRGLSATPIGRALIAYFLDLPRWTLLNILFGVSLIPIIGALLNGNTDWWIILLTSPIAIVSGGMVNMAAPVVKEDAPRWRDVLTAPATYSTALVVWGGVVMAWALFMSELPALLLFILCAVVLAFLMIGVFALFLPALLGVKGGLVWRNALVLTVHSPIVALGLLALLGVGAWGIWFSRGALVLVIPALWVMIAAYSVQDRISAIQAASQIDTTQ